MTNTIARRALVTAVALFAVLALLVRRASQPPAPVPATAPPTEFSAERAIAHVREIAQRPHPAGSPDNARVREYIVAQLRALGLDPQVQEATGIGTRYPSAGRVRNVLARLPGRTPGGLGVVLMSHYDGVAGGPAAGDAAAGTAAILETLRALEAGDPLEHDVIAVITDGEEAGLLGAAAFVREHPWAKDVGVTLNFEARGTRGRSYMFETGPGNLDVARMLRGARDVSATSLSVTVYRTLPNDTDLSEMALLGKPALNFAFADGVERYHTAHDDVAHLDPGSVQHHGAQMLALAQGFANGPLPRPATGDAVFFDAPLIGLVVYPESWAWPIAIVAMLLTIAATVRVARVEARWIRDVALGAVGTVVATAVAGGLTMVGGNLIARTHNSMGWGGAPAFRGIYAAALAAVALAVVFGVWALVRRWASARGAHVGALIVWCLLAVGITWKLPGVSFLFVWPLIALAIAALVPSTASRWIGTVAALAIVAPVVYAVAAVLLGAVGPGGIAVGVLVALVAWLLAPQLDVLASSHRWVTTGLTFALALGLVGVGMATVRSTPEHPTPSTITYTLDADGTDAWLALRGLTAGAQPSNESGARPPAWVTRYVGGGAVTVRPAPRVSLAGPTVDVISDSTNATERTVILRLRPAPEAETVSLRAVDTSVLRSTVDGQPIDVSRYRRSGGPWQLQYSAPPDSGVMLGLTIAAGSPITLETATRTRGLPMLPGVQLPSRAPNVVTAQTGDITLVRRMIAVPASTTK